MKRRAFLRTTVAAAAGFAVPWPARASLSTALPPGWREITGLGAGHLPFGDVLAVTGEGNEVVVTRSALAELARSIRGRILLAEDDGFDDARRILNPMFDRHPALIAQVTGTADVRAAVDFAREHDGLLLAVKCGGHSFSGQSTCDRGMMIDLSPFRHVRVDARARRARVSGGSLLGGVDHEAMAQGLVTPLGTVSHTGVGGLVTGGGFGRLSRTFGLSIDNLVSADVVTADGRLHRASADENPDLFWGIRGGGGNFGIVTSFEFELHPMERRVIAGRIMYPISKARDLLRLYADYAPEAPRALQIDAAVAAPPGGEPMVCGFDVCFAGGEREAERALAPLRSLGTPLDDEVAAMDYVELQRSGDTDDPRAMAMYLYGGFIPALPEDFITAIVEGVQAHPARQTAAFLVQSGGAVGDVAPDATAFSQRDAFANILFVAGWPHRHPSADEHVSWIRGAWPALNRFTHGFYVNDLSPDRTAEEIRANWQRNYARLVDVKNRYDPHNLFRLNANIPPTVHERG